MKYFIAVTALFLISLSFVTADNCNDESCACLLDGDACPESFSTKYSGSFGSVEIGSDTICYGVNGNDGTITTTDTGIVLNGNLMAYDILHACSDYASSEMMMKDEASSEMMKDSSSSSSSSSSNDYSLAVILGGITAVAFGSNLFYSIPMTLAGLTVVGFGK